MAVHASTRERASHVDELYRRLFERVGLVASVVDIGCGLNPLAIPWMRLSADAVYIAVDIEKSLTAFVAQCLELMPVQGRAMVADAISAPPREPVDLALVLKMVPCLEQQQRGAGADLVNALDARHVVVSFPVRSLGGRGKGMHENYAKLFEELARQYHWRAEAVPVPGELLYVITK
jgi:16S rRNA (guanine(1405)-N(7))-methyltransferase